MKPNYPDVVYTAAEIAAFISLNLCVCILWFSVDKLEDKVKMLEFNQQILIIDYNVKNK